MGASKGTAPCWIYVVRHINGNCSDNRIENLEIQSYCVRFECKRLQKLNAELLATLREIVKEIRAYQSPECDDAGTWGADLLKQADAAIVKATGVGGKSGAQK
jgi:HNH endonuclease